MAASRVGCELTLAPTQRTHANAPPLFRLPGTKLSFTIFVIAQDARRFGSLWRKRLLNHTSWVVAYGRAQYHWLLWNLIVSCSPICWLFLSVPRTGQSLFAFCGFEYASPLPCWCCCCPAGAGAAAAGDIAISAFAANSMEFSSAACKPPAPVSAGREREQPGKSPSPAQPLPQTIA